MEELRKEHWLDLKTIVRISSYREDKKAEAFSNSFRYCISSLDAELINKSVRSHWAIENNLHWNLDVII